jgi:hypothetical protein
MTRHRRICCILLACICCLCFSITCYARAGGGSSGGTYHYEYWTFIREDGRWVLNEIQQKDEVDVHEL